MPTLYDMLANAQNGEAMAAMARQFNLTRQQTQAAVEALLPAFSQGLKRNVADAYGVGAFLSSLSSGQYGQYHDNPASAFSPAGVAQGNAVLGQIFGSPDLSRAIAQQASLATGIGQEVMKQMLPVIASMIMGGLFKQATGQFSPSPAAGYPGQANYGSGLGGGNPLGEIIAEMMRQGGGMLAGQQPQQRQAPQTPNPMDNPFGKILQDMFGGAAQQQAQPRPGAQPTQNPFGDNPFGKIFEEMMRGGQQAPEPQAAPEQPRPPENPSGRARNPYDDIFGQMFETGRKQRDDYEKNVGSVFDQFLKGMDKQR